MILLDTCVISEALRPDPSSKVTAWLEDLQEEQVYLPALVIGELEKGVELLPKGYKQAALRLWLEQLRRRFKGRILPFDEETAVLWGSLTARCRKSGRRLPVIDSMLAAIALRHAALLATRNVSDYDDTGADVVNPWA
ncbi:MAG: type II toxin-antitoxin system VapC family toxin [Spirochaetota bacterium]|nr:type II toxin-antitoxin system VapC family toxin [Spirochaetota bacterium]